MHYTLSLPTNLTREALEPILEDIHGNPFKFGWTLFRGEIVVEFETEYPEYVEELRKQIEEVATNPRHRHYPKSRAHLEPTWGGKMNGPPHLRKSLNAEKKGTSGNISERVHPQ